MIRIGLVGLDSSHATAFTAIFNAETPHPGCEGMKVVAGLPASSPDLPTSADRVEKYTQELRERGITIVDNIDELLPLVDVVLMTSVDGRVHPKLARPVILAGKPLYIDKPMANSVAEAKEIFELAREHNVPCFSTSSLRYCEGVADHRNESSYGEVIGCDTSGPCTQQLHHPDVFWYGIHGVEMLFTIMGSGCETVTCTRTDGTDVIVGQWKDGRIGTFRGIRAGSARYGVAIVGSKGSGAATVSAIYQPLMVEISKFFRTGKSPVPEEETLEVLGFMEAANESHRLGGVPVKMKR
ncbi:Gfo/Idh/MocA family protein [Planctomicrobium sp. SH668]|uniref:Gfo/Idh/MocA family protein n=1 Tax=Planctomicrobium sp. SH668 TaxID=3448126 RepID=UPI003F5C5196